MVIFKSVNCLNFHIIKAQNTAAQSASPHVHKLIKFVKKKKKNVQMYSDDVLFLGSIVTAEYTSQKPADYD